MIGRVWCPLCGTAYRRIVGIRVRCALCGVTVPDPLSDLVRRRR